MKASDVIKATRNVVGRHTVAGGGVALALTNDDPWIRRAALLALVVNAVADYVIELRARATATIAAEGNTAPASPGGTT